VRGRMKGRQEPAPIRDCKMAFLLVHAFNSQPECPRSEHVVEKLAAHKSWVLHSKLNQSCLVCARTLVKEAKVRVEICIGRAGSERQARRLIYKY